MQPEPRDRSKHATVPGTAVQRWLSVIGTAAGLLIVIGMIASLVECRPAIGEGEQVVHQLMAAGKAKDAEAYLSLISDTILTEEVEEGVDMRKKTVTTFSRYGYLFNEYQGLESTGGNYQANFSTAGLEQILQIEGRLRYVQGAQGSFQAELVNRGRGWAIDYLYLKRGVVYLYGP